jgi:hypothetical protein
VIKNGRYQFTEDCDRVPETLRRIGDKWSVLIIVLVELGPRRFNDLKRSIPGISQRMLTLTLPPAPLFAGAVRPEPPDRADCHEPRRE